MNQSLPKKLPEWVAPLALLALAAAVYGPFLSQLGFYWDDWVFAWKRAYFGPLGLIEEFYKNRPMRGYVEIPFTWLLGINPLAWQVYGLIIRWGAGCSFWYFLRRMWPERRAAALFAAALFIVYPGFTHQPLVMTYHYFWLFYVVLFLSLVLMLRAARAERFSWPVYLLALVLSAAQLFASEYMVSLEVLRPAFLWLALGSLAAMPRERLKKAILLEIPFALVLAIYFFWRLVLFKNPMYSPTLTGETLLALPAGILNTLATVNLTAWLQTFQLPDFSQAGTLLTGFYVLMIMGILVGWPFFVQRNDEKYPLSAPWDWIALGLAGMVLAAVPFLLGGLPFRLVFPEDRFVLAFLPFVGLFFAGLLELLPNPSNRYWMAGLLLALAANFHFQSLSTYRDDWKAQKNFIWQLAWRAPKLAAGTVVLSEDYDTFRFNDDESFTPVLNWMYIPRETGLPYSYRFIFPSLRLSQDLPELLKNPSHSNFLVMRYAPPGCLHVFDPAYDDILLSLPERSDVAALSALNLPVVPALIGQAAPLSNPALTTSGSFPAVVPQVLGPEPARQWCYYYQQASLARQQGDWEKVARLGDEAFAIPYYPDDPYEFLPFIEAYARLGRIKEARLLTRQVAESMPLLKPALCSVWGRVPTIQAGTVQEMRQELQICPVNP